LKILATAAVFAGAVALAGPPAWAVDETGLFELEFDANAVANDGPGDDWETLWDACGDGGSPAPCGSSVVFTGIRSDPSGVTIFTGGDKDIQDLPDLGNTSGSTPPKNEIQHAFAAAYTCGDPGSPATIDCAEGDLIIYFGADRDSHNGDAFLGFWFFQNTVGLSNGGFNGTKSNGDLLMLVNFPQSANSEPIIAAVEWDTSCSKKLDHTPDPGECVAKNLKLLGIAQGDGLVRCDLDKGTSPPVPLHLFCASTNDTSQASPWPYEPVDSGETSEIFPFETFYEGGVNLTALTGGGSCVASFMAESRSSSSFTAQLKDFLVADFPLCSIAGSKVCTPSPAPSVCEFDSASTCAVNSDCDQVGVCDDNGAACTAADLTACENSGSASCVISGDDVCIVKGFCLETASACTEVNEETVCIASASDRCIIANPYIDSDGITIVMENDVVITNDGIATIYDVRFKENTTFGIGEFCEIVAVNGAAVTAVGLPNGTFKTVPNGGGYDGDLIKDETVTATIRCETGSNPFLNQVDIEASSVDDSNEFDIVDLNVNLQNSNLCQAAPNPQLGLQKSCVDVRLMSTGSELVVEVLTEITVTNTGDVRLDNIEVTDKIGDDETTIDSGLTLDPGDSVTYNLVDMPIVPTINPTPLCTISGASCGNGQSDCDATGIVGDICNSTTKYVPDGAHFDDTANATGIDALVGATVNATAASVTDCFLCPQD
jgi:hypothetical protein